MFDSRKTTVEHLIRSQLQSEEELTDQRSSHFKLRIAVNCGKKSAPSFDLPFSTVMTKLNLQAQALSCGWKNVPC